MTRKPHLSCSMCLYAIVVGCGQSPSAPRADPDLAQATVDCKPASNVRVILPDDEAPHAEATEWWYWTGHLEDSQGRRYGFEQVFFLIRIGTFATGIMAHHALTDVAAERFDFDVQFAAWNGIKPDVGFEFVASPQTAVGAGGHDTIHGELSGSVLDLELQATQEPVFQHNDGYQEYPFGGYTYYYSRERMTASGTLNIEGEERQVSGTAWFDHQWGALGQATDAGWDWFAIQLDDGREIMATVIHPAGQPEFSSGSISDPSCGTIELHAEDVSINAVDEWTSPHSGCTYPMGWELDVAGTHLVITPVMLDQELHSREKTYWEGAATVTGDVTGRAYVELVTCP